MLIKTATKIEKGNFSKIIKNLQEKHIFQRSGACFERLKSIKKRIRKQNEFWKAFLMDFASILKVIVEAKSFKIRCQNWINKWMQCWETVFRRRKGPAEGTEPPGGGKVGWEGGKV